MVPKIAVAQAVHPVDIIFEAEDIYSKSPPSSGRHRPGPRFCRLEEPNSSKSNNVHVRGRISLL